LGNHEYHSSKVAQPYFDYFSANKDKGFLPPSVQTSPLSARHIAGVTLAGKFGDRA
jgi:hypothetical protein